MDQFCHSESKNKKMIWIFLFLFLLALVAFWWYKQNNKNKKMRLDETYDFLTAEDACVACCSNESQNVDKTNLNHE